MKFPQHIVEMAISWTRGVDVRYPLHDALLEMGYDEYEVKSHLGFSQNGFVGCTVGCHCTLICDILREYGGCPITDAWRCCGRYLDACKEM